MKRKEVMIVMITMRKAMIMMTMTEYSMIQCWGGGQDPELTISKFYGACQSFVSHSKKSHQPLDYITLYTPYFCKEHVNDFDRELVFVGSQTKHAQRRSDINEQKLKEESSKHECHMMMPPPMIKPRGALDKSGIGNLMPPPPSHTSSSSQSKRIQGARRNDRDAEESRETRGAAVKVHEEIAEEPKIKEPIKEKKVIKGPMRPPTGN
mmetsp:Transcript_12581/g.18876  ORF Transcript_12581/g.18876 Transcript_12581/m.18876 type:complete len:208 (-) Transcript_12581:6-629(-)